MEVARWNIEARSRTSITRELTLLTTLLFAVSDNAFFMLHGVTLWFSLRQSLAVMDLDGEQKQVFARCVRSFLLTLLGVYVALGRPGHDHPALSAWLTAHPQVPCAHDSGASVTLESLAEKYMAWYSEPEHSHASLKGFDWESIIKAAVADSTEDEHTFKLIYVLRQDATETFAWDPLLSELCRVTAIQYLSNVSKSDRLFRTRFVDRSRA